ncbi:globin domain-containing protein [Nocardia australiensis]|uniref:globin domain-containing protein n=1 Tax=Nocardia australiensis TaxID=2887191 RepID=UPI001D14DD1D|nr:hypothetical protein [Nocardia australiensis]
MTSLYEHAGGDDALHRVEAAFYDKVLADPILRAQFTERHPDHVDRLTWFTAESFGGPDRKGWVPDRASAARRHAHNSTILRA